MQIWDLIVSIFTIFVTIEIPVRLAFGLKSHGFMLVLDWLITIIFVADMIRHMRSSRKLWLFADILPAIPVFILPLAPQFQFFRLLKLLRIMERMRKWLRSESYNTNLMRLVIFAFWLALISHWIACGWLEMRGIAPGLDEVSNYIQALYWCITTLTTVGYGDITPSTNLETLYTMMVMMMGVAVYGYVIGSVASILSKIDPARTRHREIVEKITAFMRYRQIPLRLQRRILDYYEYLWTKRLGYNEAAAVASLPPTLRAEVSLVLNQEIIEKVPLFAGASDEFIRAIAVKMHPRIYLPYDYIIRASEIGDEMYFISRGKVEVISPDGGTIYATLTGGDFFGEMALLYDQPRTANVRSIGYCDLYTLNKNDFNSILALHPEVAERIKSIADKRSEDNK